MKYLLFILVFVTLSFAAGDGCFETRTVVNPHTSGTDAITLTLVNNWTQSQQVLGLDALEGASELYVLGVDNENSLVQAYDATSGVIVGTLSLDAANGGCFGVAWNNDTDSEAYYTNDWAGSNLFYTDDLGSSWTTVANPANNDGRGMDFDGTDYWEAVTGGGGLWRFQPGVGQQNIAISAPPSNTSGLTVFPNGSNLGIAVACYMTYNIYFYEWDGSTIDYLGAAACPVSGISGSYGLAYAETTDTIFWSFKMGTSEYHLAEFSFDLTALERSSWGSIKTSF